MRPSLRPRLINGVFDDPGLFIPFAFQNRAFIFDLGDIHSLPARELHKVSHVFITHTHMDHFIGFDRMLRLFLGRNRDLYLFGPRNFIKNIEGRLAGYTWNLVENYTARLTIHATEVRPGILVTKRFCCHNRFQTDPDVSTQPFSGQLLTEPSLVVRAAILDHGIPSLAFTLEERFHVNIMKEKVVEMGLKIGPWLKRFKQALYDEIPADSAFHIDPESCPGCGFEVTLGELAGRIARISAGQKITYVTDVGFTPSNQEKIIELADRADHLFIEAAFLHKDRATARDKYHLTARQAGEIAAKARVKRFTLFHFSPRYNGQESLFEAEAGSAYARILDQHSSE